METQTQTPDHVIQDVPENPEIREAQTILLKLLLSGPSLVTATELCRLVEIINGGTT